MTTDRRKAILYLVITLVIGIFIGSLLPGFLFRMRHRDMADRDKMERSDKGGRDRKPFGKKEDWLANTIIRVVKPDSDQVKAIRPLAKEATDKIVSLEKNSNGRMVAIMDSLKLQLKPILTDDQNKKLEEFSAKARSKWRRR